MEKITLDWVLKYVVGFPQWAWLGRGTLRRKEQLRCRLEVGWALQCWSCQRGAMVTAPRDRWGGGQRWNAVSTQAPRCPVWRQWHDQSTASNVRRTEGVSETRTGTFRREGMTGTVKERAWPLWEPLVVEVAGSVLVAHSRGLRTRRLMNDYTFSRVWAELKEEATDGDTPSDWQPYKTIPPGAVKGAVLLQQESRGQEWRWGHLRVQKMWS